IADEPSRMRLFQDYIECGGNVNQIIAKHEQSLREAQVSQIRFGFRTIADPECPDDSLYFVFVEINVDDIREIQRITKLELAGQIDAEMLKAFTEAGGVLDPRKQLALGNGVSADTMGKALQMMGSGAPASGAAKAKAKASKGKADPSKATKVGRQELLQVGDRCINTFVDCLCSIRDYAFKLKPLKLSATLIDQLLALEKSFSQKATISQSFVVDSVSIGVVVCVAGWGSAEPCVDEEEQEQILQKHHVRGQKLLKDK
ncbi:unnamed protein product, partial [Symbiodinium necroappetens]